MPYSYRDFLSAANASGLMGEFSQEDLELAEKYPEFGMSILNLKRDWHSAGTPEQRLLANQAANELRSSYGNYRGGVTGTSTVSDGKIPGQIDSTLDRLQNYGSFNWNEARPEFNSQYSDAQRQMLDRLQNYGSFDYQETRPEFQDPYAGQSQETLGKMQDYGPFEWNEARPEYQNRYAEQQQALLDELLGRGPFEWSKETDPLWSTYRKEYLREGQRASADALGQAAAASAGRPSSYAVTAAQQAGDYYAGQLSDVIPTLYQQAYDRWLNEYNLDRQNLGTLNEQAELDYQQYLDALNQWNADRSFAYGQYNDDYDRLRDLYTMQRNEGETAYDRYLDELGQWNSDRNFAYGQYTDEYNRLRDTLGALQGQDELDYNRYLDALEQWNADRNFAYGQYSDDYNRLQSTLGALQGQAQSDYNKYLDTLEQERLREQEDYERAWNESERDYARQLEAAETLAALGDFSGYRGLGYSDAQIAEMERAWQAANAPTSSYSGGGGGSTGGQSGAPSPSGSIAALGASVAQSATTPKVYIEGLGNKTAEETLDLLDRGLIERYEKDGTVQFRMVSPEQFAAATRARETQGK